MEAPFAAPDTSGKFDLRPSSVLFKIISRPDGGRSRKSSYSTPVSLLFQNPVNALTHQAYAINRHKMTVLTSVPYKTFLLARDANRPTTSPSYHGTSTLPHSLRGALTDPDPKLRHIPRMTVRDLTFMLLLSIVLTSCRQVRRHP